MKYNQTLEQNINELIANSFVNDLNAEKAGIVAAGIALGVDIKDIDDFYQKVQEKLSISLHSTAKIYACYIEAAYEVRTKGE